MLRFQTCARAAAGSLLGLLGSLAVAGAQAQTQGQAQASADQPAQTSQDDPTIRIKLPTITVIANKVPTDVQSLPASVSAVSKETIDRDGITIVSDAAIFAPNVYFTEFTARKLSNVRFRGIGSSPNNPGVTTYIDGVPQLNANTSSSELLDVQQIEFVRGPQSALFGRNTLGGLLSVESTRPSRSQWTGALSVPIGNVSAWGVKANASGPVVTDKLSVGIALAHTERNGFTVNDVTGNDIDTRSAFFGKGQVLWTPTQNWEARVIISGERDRDGDYGLNDLASLRSNPFHSARDFEGRTDRNIFGTTIQTRRTGGPIVLSTTTGFVNWKTQDVTDLDYTPLSLVVRDNTEKDFQFTQEVRLASADNAAVRLSDALSLKWQAGAFFFTQNYEQDAINTYSPGLLSPFVLFPVNQHSPQSELDDVGIGLFGQATFVVNDRLDLIGGARFDHESKDAVLRTFYDPQIAPGSTVNADASFSQVSPQFAAAYRLRPEHMIYGTITRGFKAGGFNAASPQGSEAYGEEHAWHVEGGTKTTWLQGRLSLNASLFYIDWQDLQLNVPNPDIPAQFYIANVGQASSVGAEVELAARAAPGIDLFSGFGVTRARFGEGSVSSGVDVEDNDIPNTPDYTISAGVQYSRALTSIYSLYGRAEVVGYGAFQYDDLNTQGQEAYALAHFRGGVRGRFVFAEAWIRNAFDTRYIPVAFAYGSLAPSGFVGEMGAPRTFGVNLGVTF